MFSHVTFIEDLLFSGGKQEEEWFWGRGEMGREGTERRGERGTCSWDAMYERKIN